MAPASRSSSQIGTRLLPKTTLAVFMTVGYILLRSAKNTESMTRSRSRSIQNTVAIPSVAAIATVSAGRKPSDADQYPGRGTNASIATDALAPVGYHDRSANTANAAAAASVPAMPATSAGGSDNAGGMRSESLKTEPLAEIAIAEKLVNPDDRCNGAAFVVGVGQINSANRKPNSGQFYCTCAKPYICKGPGCIIDYDFDKAKVYDSPPPLSLMGFAVYPKDCGPACACVPANEASRHLRTIPLPEDTTKSAARQAIAQIITGYTEDIGTMHGEVWAAYGGPEEFGNRMQHFLNHFIVAIVTKRKLVPRFTRWKPASTREQAYLDGLMHIQDWAKPYVFEKLHADDSNSGLTIIGRKGYWGRNMLCEKLDVDVDGNGTEVAGHSRIQFPMLEWQQASVLAIHKGQLSCDAGGNTCKERSKTLFALGADHLYGSLFNSIFEFDKALVVDPVLSALPAHEGQHFRIAIHTRHPHSNLKGDEMLDLYWGAARDILNERRATPGGDNVICIVLLASDRELTIKALRPKAEADGCIVVTALKGDDGTMANEADEHGSQTGVTALRDIMLLSQADALVGTRKSSFSTFIAELFSARYNADPKNDQNPHVIMCSPIHCAGTQAPRYNWDRTWDTQAIESHLIHDPCPIRKPLQMKRKVCTMPVDQLNSDSPEWNYDHTTAALAVNPKWPRHHYAAGGAAAAAARTSSSTNICRTGGTWNWDGTTFTQDEDCRPKIAAWLGDYDRITTMTFIGAEHVRMLYEEVGYRYYRRGKCKLRKGGEKNRCGLMEFMDLPKGPWIAPQAKLEGPGKSTFGSTSKGFCTDVGCAWGVCHRFYAQAHDCDIAAVDGRKVEYLPVEYARDVVNPTVGTRTTQETLGRYLTASSERDLCMISTGLDDIKCVDDSNKGLGSVIDNPNQYVLNVAEFIQHIEGGCRKIMWLHMPAVCGRKFDCVSNKKILAWNRMVEFMLVTHFPDVMIIDVFNMTLSPVQHGCACDEDTREWTGSLSQMGGPYGNLVASWLFKE